jgi:glycosyltransferase involved in cell wall biosynthesis
LDVELVTVTGADEPPFRALIAPGMTEVRIPKSREHEAREREMEAQVGLSCGDVAMPRLYRLTPACLDALRASCRGADLAVASHPYLYPALQEASDLPLWYEAHNVEFDLKKALLPDNAVGRDLLAATREAEGACCREARLIMACSPEDGAALQALYGADPARIVMVPNGVDLDSVRYVPLPERIAVQRRLGLEASFTALFFASLHGPNLEAARHVLKMAERLPQVRFLIAGSVCTAAVLRKRPANVGLMGVVDDVTKEVVLGVAHVAVNPMCSGSGTNLKMLDYCAAGVPVVSTPFGVRGLALRDGEHVALAELDEFPAAIGRAQEQWPALGSRVERARDYVAARFDWRLIAERLLARLGGGEG